MEIIICRECSKEFKSLDSLRRHRSQIHNVSSEQTYIDYKLNGIRPTCACGCGEDTNFLSFGKGFVDYVLGHAARIHNNWGHNPTAIKKSHEKQKEMYESGELAIWNKGLTTDDPRVKDNIEKMLSNPDRGKNISKALTNKPKSSEHKKRLSETAKKRWSDPKEREQQSNRRMLWMRENDYTVKSKLEEVINDILIEFGLVEEVDYQRQYYVRPIKSYFDFKIVKTNTLIEIDGDFWHCNPDTDFKEPVYECQFKNLEKDKVKDEWCNENKITLIRFWESDINNNINNVKSILKTVLS